MSLKAGRTSEASEDRNAGLVVAGFVEGKICREGRGKGGALPKALQSSGRAVERVEEKPQLEPKWPGERSIGDTT